MEFLLSLKLAGRRGGEYSADADNDADITAENDVYDDDDDDDDTTGIVETTNKLKLARQRPTRNPTRHLLMGPCIDEIDCIVIRDVQYQFEVIRCRNEEVNFPGSSANSTDGRTNGGFQGSNINSVGEENGWDRRTDGGDNHIIPSFSPKNVGITTFVQRWLASLLG
ncbi:hypothetical protein DPMN_163658 [Dreissena polymorpha]|uniref:Uncharacterized protein n=1 Tax=Dreissena polymorpha TaxID=45954 RepID=A0A9D4EX71_DREPO|nr:hypothetical protein DPMN_163658 [Dreissena polymorpha]